MGALLIAELALTELRAAVFAIRFSILQNLQI